MTRSLITAFLVSGVALTAHAAGVKLPAAAHEVVAKSWQSRGGRNKIGMHVRIDKAHPESKIEIERQKRSVEAEVSGEIASEQELHAASRKASQWATHLTLMTANESTKQPHDSVHLEAAEVMRPHSRFRVKYTTRDDQNGVNHGLAVLGREELVDTRHDVVTGQPTQVSKGGKNMKPARAWVMAKNLFVTAPEVDEKMIASGRAKLAEAQSHLEHLEKLSSDMQTIGPQLSQTDPAKYAEMQQEIGALPTKITEAKAEGDRLVAEGNRSLVRVMSVGALPVNAHVDGENVRLTGEGDATKPSFSVSSHAEHGFLHEELEAVDRDKVRLTVHFSGEHANASSHSLAFRVGTERDKPAFTYQGRKYYRVDAKDVVQRNEDPAE